jgi:hypothetical protein
MLPAPEFNSLIAEIIIIVESAHAVVESFARHRIVPSLDVDGIVRFLDEAGDLLVKAIQLGGGIGPIFHARAANDNDAVQCVSPMLPACPVKRLVILTGVIR